MLRIIETFNHLPISVIPDPNLQCQPGQFVSLKLKNGKELLEICDGLNPIGIVDDIRADSFRHTVCDEEVIVSNPFINQFPSRDEKDYSLMTAQDIKVELKHPNIIAKSFVSQIPVQLYPINGVITIPAGTKCNYHIPSHDSYMDEKGRSVVPAIDGIRFTVSYAYRDGLPGGYDDSTQGSNRAAVWDKMMIAETDMYDTAITYPKYAVLYVENGFLTTNRCSYSCKAVGVVLAAPTSERPMVKFLFDPDGVIKIGSSLDFILDKRCDLLELQRGSNG
jgi:hypothetical protein